MSELLSIQRRFRRALSAEGTAQDLGPNAAPGLAVHKTTIKAGLMQTLVNVFPAARRVVGAPTFAILAGEFIDTSPPRHPVLAVFGREFPQFLHMRPIGASLPYLQDLAKVEWMRQEAYLAADAAVLDVSQIDTADPEALSALSLPVHPATRVISSPFPVHRIWRLNQSDVDDKDIPAVDMKISEAVLITRPGNEIVTRAISLADAALVCALGEGARLGAAVDAALAIARDFNVTEALASHFAGGTFSGGET